MPAVEPVAGAALGVVLAALDDEACDELDALLLEVAAGVVEVEGGDVAVAVLVVNGSTYC